MMHVLLAIRGLQIMTQKDVKDDMQPGGWEESRNGVLLTPSYPVGARGKGLRKRPGFGIRRRGFDVLCKR
jgi:hypothetical protein